MTDQEVIIIADRLPQEWEVWFDGYQIERSGEGNVTSFHCQLDKVMGLADDEKVVLVEDDYLWIPGAFDLMDKALNELDLISPYDHPGHYLEDRFKYEPKQMRLIDNQTWRQAPSNTLTFATHARIIKENIDFIKSMGLQDHGMFVQLKHDMFVPVPSLATHCVSWLMAPNRIWI